MIKLKEIPRENALGFVLDGEIVESELQELFVALDQKAAAFGKVRLYGEVRNIGGWKDFKAFWSTMKGKFKSLGKLEKYALVTDKDWLEELGGLADFITPNMDVKFFEMDEQEKAIAWLDAPLKDELFGSRELDLGFDDILAFSIYERLTQADYNWFNQEMADQVRRFGKIKMYVELEDFEGMSLKAIWADLKSGLKFYRDIEKVALVGDEGWLKNATKVADFLTPGIELEYFDITEKHKALDWLH